MQLRTLTYWANRLTARWLPATVFCVLRYRLTQGHWPHLRQPKRLSEKILCSFLYDHDPRRRIFADKLAMRDYAQQKLPDCRLPEVLGVYDSFNQIEFDRLPERYVVKANHGSGYVQIVTDTQPLNKAQLARACDAWLSQDYSHYRREWYYRGLPRRLMIEEFLAGADGGPADDYKVFVANGKILMVMVSVDRFSKHRRSAFTAQWELLPLRYNRDQGIDRPVPPPRPLAQMLDYSLKLAEGLQFLRVDFYVVDDVLYLGELTNTPDAGNLVIVPEEWDLRLGEQFGPVTTGRQVG